LQSPLESFLIGVVEACLLPNAAQGRNRPARLSAKLDRARQVIEANLANAELRPEDIGEAIGLSRRSLYRMFSQVGRTPMEYVYELRLAEAARKLRSKSGDYHGITRLALDVGFADSSHFSRSFRSRYGMSPKQWAAGR
jgi:AraC-like DNA-binding protein